MPTKAHLLSQPYIIDPTYSAEKPSPEPNTFPEKKFWHYAPGDYLLAMLERLAREYRESKRLVGYPGKRRTIAYRITFLRDFPEKTEIELQIAGHAEIFLNGSKICEKENERFSLSLPAKSEVKITIEDELIPALCSDFDWDLLSGGNRILPDKRAVTKSGKAPHLDEVPEITLEPELLPNGFYDAGREVFGFIETEGTVLPRLTAGESLYEAENTNPSFNEQDLDLYETEDGKYRTKHPAAFRYFKLYGGNFRNTRCRLLYSPVRYRGAFAGSESWNRIWMRSAYTLRLCSHHFILDGVKRDRMPWAGDFSLSLQANAYTFADREILKDSMTVLGCSGPEYGDINGITDFTCWHIVAHDLYQRFFADMPFLERSWKTVRAWTDSLIARSSEEGFLVQGLDWVLLDWTPGEKTTALQILFYLTLHAAARLADRMGKEAEKERWLSHAAKLERSLYAKCYDPHKHLFTSGIGHDSTPGMRHQQMLALLSGLAKEEDRPFLLDLLCGSDTVPFGTPFMKTLELLSAGRERPAYFRREIDRIWGYQLSEGATTFWEGYDKSGQIESVGADLTKTICKTPGEYTSHKEYCEYYGRPYGASLCHGWGSGPAMLFPRVLMGLEPVGDGWKTFRCSPLPGFGGLHCTVPTPYGPIEAEFENGKLALHHPSEIRKI